MIDKSLFIEQALDKKQKKDFKSKYNLNREDITVIDLSTLKKLEIQEQKEYL
jgi:hypothetical protein